MNTRNSYRKNCENSSYASTASTSRISSEDCSSFQTFDDENSASDDDDDDISILAVKLERLKGTYSERKFENTVLKRCMEVKSASTFMNNLFLNKELNDSTSEEQKRMIKELYEKNRELFSKVKKVTKKNKSTVKEVFELYMSVQDLMEERKRIWDEAVETHKLNLGDVSAFFNWDESDQFNESNGKQKLKEKLIKSMDFGVVTKHFQVMRVARILYNFISNSEVNWSEDKNLLEILNCTGKMLDSDFELKYRAQCIKTVDEVTHRLNKIKI